MMRRLRRPMTLLTAVVVVLGIPGATLGGSTSAAAAQEAAQLTAESPRAVTPQGEGVVIEGAVTEDAKPVRGAEIRVTLVAPDGSTLASPIETVTGSDGSYDLVFPAEATGSLEIDESNDFQLTLAARVEVLTGAAAGQTKAVPVAVTAAPPSLLIENLFVSSVGWVKPGETYPSRLVVRNMTGQPRNNVVVEVPVVDGMSFVSGEPIGDAGTANIDADGTLVWELGTVPAGSVDDPTVRTLVVQAKADTLAQDPRIVWKDISTTANLISAGSEASAASHGPKVVPQNDIHETARYGDRPFPVVPIDYLDLSHIDSNSGAELTTVINDPSFEGSTFNLFQEMSYGQLFPNGTVPSADIATATWDGFDIGKFHEASPNPPDCEADDIYDPNLAGTPELPERIINGFYQLPGAAEFYGTDDESVAEFPIGAIDSGCGPTGKAVFDAAAVADPEIDYNDYDTDKDGVVDFFMLVFAGCGGNGPSQRGCDAPDYQTDPYDNIWPHSSNLEAYFVDDETGLPGYMSDDRLRDLAGNLVFYTDSTYTVLTTEETDFPAFVRVGPYNVNPETSLEAASVISHEYGHSLGLPDYYATTGGVGYYGTWNLMAADYSQHMDLNGRQELGWVIPREIPDDVESFETSMVDSTVDTHTIEWRTPDGTPYTLSGPNIHNGDAWMAPLPGRILLDPALVENGASPTHVYWSGSGNDFACVPGGAARSLDIPLDVLAAVDQGTEVTLEINSYWDIEWDFDYGFVLATTDNGANYTSLPSLEGYTFPADDNPNDVGCQDKFGNGLSGTSGAWEDGDGLPDRGDGAQTPGTGFLPVSYDLSDFAGQATNIRFAYNSDVGLARPGWFIDDITVRAGDEVIYTNDLEAGPDDGVVNGGCDESGGVLTGPCSEEWSYVTAGEASLADHAYYLELRDRTGFDFDARGQSDRGPITWNPGVSLGYTDEATGYGNTQTFANPNQTVLDAEPVPLDTGPIEDTINPDLDDAAWLPSSEPYSDFGEGHAENYLLVDPEGNFQPWVLAHDCLQMDVTSMVGGDVGPSIPPGNLEAEISLTRGDGCGERDYGFGGLANTAPTAAAQAKPMTVAVGEHVTFDGSASADDITPATELEYEWDPGDGSATLSGREAIHVYDEVGTYEVTLTVTDEDGLSDFTTINVQVVASPLESVEVTPTRVNLAVGDMAQLTATATFEDGTSLDVTGQTAWTSLVEDVATVSTGALVTAQGPGSVEIEAVFQSETDTARVIVRGGGVGPPPTEPGQEFLDVSPDDLFYDDIQWLAGEGITIGCNPPDNTLFCPDDSVSRGQMAAFLNRTLDLSATDTDHFEDDEESVFEDDINRLAESGITIGCNPPDNTLFCVDDNVSRAQMASFLTRAYELEAPDEPDRFSDDDESVHELDIEAIAEAGITIGCNPPDNTMFCPEDDVLREQMAAFLHRASRLNP